MKKIHLVYNDTFTSKYEFVSILAQEFNLRVISIGECIRNEIKLETPLGTAIKAHIDKGEIVPPQTILSILEKEITLDEKDVLVYNLPVNETYYRELHSLFKSIDVSVAKIWYLKADLNYVSQEQFNSIGKAYLAKYAIDKEVFEDQIKESQAQKKKHLSHWKVDYEITTFLVTNANFDLLTWIREEKRKNDA